MSDLMRMVIELAAYVKALEFENMGLKKTLADRDQKIEEMAANHEQALADKKGK